MRKIHLAGFAIVAMLVFSAFSVASASALEYLISGNPVKAGEKFTIDVTVLPAKALFLEDMKEGIGLACLEVETGAGEVTSPTEGIITEGKCKNSSIDVEKGTCGSPELVAVDLPWKTILTSESLTEILEDGKGEPGWLAECTILGIKVNDTCVTNGGKPSVANGEEEELATTFSETETSTEEATCSVPKEKVGLIHGELMLKALVGGVLLSFTVS